ncbi:kynurenine--oxoglutarate transaminase 3-like isoform X1 [Ostrea edulis]|uniref:kynurenine--oxoglutarate transaminase 3-like isoform X1 n=2 Tax=Ostrea edulis TaxID=37623 RepID=UPI00209631F6|nr:kynurenine--oxoglutarate transaminase 3-like isoform X1 [Ostrea edulis]XP_048772557.1 kynurenine--oxoglutarate transaminase 3-like isoform X1 [Ostrea edulis]
MRVLPLILTARRGGISAWSRINRPKNSPVTSQAVRTMASKLTGADRIKGTEKNIWVEFGKLAVENEALNLGQGFPDFKPPQHVIDEMVTAVASDNHLMHQYTRSFGHPRLVSALTKLYSPLIGQELDPNKNVTVSVGAYGVLFCAVQGLLNPGDEAVIIEPYFDCYEPMVKVAGATPFYCPLRPTKTGQVTSSRDWKLDPKELESKFSEKTKAVFINNPNNPVGKVYSREELQMVADLCIKYNVICLSDEVYEWMVYDDNKHIKIASLPGMWERTVTIGSAGKTFSATGWKLGWAVGPEELIFPMQILHQNCTYNCPTPVQEAVAGSLEYEMKMLDQPDKCYFYSLAKELQPKRDMLTKICQEAGLSPVVPEGGYFMMVNTTGLNVDFPDDGTNDPRDFKFVRWMTKELKLAAIPPSAFYNQEHKNLGENYIRFCFIKKDETIAAAGDILKKWSGSLKK